MDTRWTITVPGHYVIFTFVPKTIEVMGHARWNIFKVQRASIRVSALGWRVAIWEYFLQSCVAVLLYWWSFGLSLPKEFLANKNFLLTVYRDFKKSKIVSLARLKKEFLELFCELFGKFLISCREKRYVLFIVSKVLRLFFPSFTEYIVYNRSQVWIALSIETNQ